MNKLNEQALQTLISQHQWWFTPSELHGILTALTVFNRIADWPAILSLGNDEYANQLIPELQQHIESSLASNELNYQLLLADDTQISDYAESLAMWAQGFSLALNYLREQSHLSKLDTSSQDFCNDLAEIGKLDSAIPDSEENRQKLIELEEHARMGALMVFASTHKKT